MSVRVYTRTSLHECNYRCDKDVHYDVVTERHDNFSREELFSAIPDYLKVISAERVNEYPDEPDVIGGWGIYFSFVDEK